MGEVVNRLRRWLQEAIQWARSEFGVSEGTTAKSKSTERNNMKRKKARARKCVNKGEIGAARWTKTPGY
eukprot:6084326-Pleurochrysis_carterae.AAC.2